MKMKALLLFGALALCLPASAQVKIGNNPQAIDASSLLELESTDRVLVITRVSTAQMEAITPSVGALVFNTDAGCLYYYDGAQWVNICESLPITFDTRAIENPAPSIVITQLGDTLNFEVARNGIRSENIVDFSIGSQDIQNNAINDQKLAPNSVGTEELQDNAVGLDELDFNAVTLAQFTNDAGFITSADIISADPGNDLTAGGDGGAYFDAEPLEVMIFDNADAIAANTAAIAANAAAIAADGDTDATNELQDLALAGNTLSIANGNSVDLTPYLDNTDDQQITDLSLSGANVLSLTLENGGTQTVDLNGLNNAGTDDQNLTFVGTDLSIEDGNTVSLAGLEESADIAANTTLINNHVAADGDLSATNEIQNISEVLTDGNDAGALQIKNLADPTDPQDAATRAYVDSQAFGGAIISTDANNSVIAGTDGGAFYEDPDDDPINEIQNIAEVLANGNDAGATQIKNLADPTDPQDAATRAYVDSQIAVAGTIVSTDINNSIVAGGDGGSFYNDPDNDPLNEIQNIAEVLAEGNDAGALQIKNLADPTDPQDAATRQYVDDIAIAGGSIPTDELINSFILNDTSLEITEASIALPAVDLDPTFVTEAELAALSVDDADADPTNELSDLNLIGNLLTLTNAQAGATGVDLSAFANTDSQDLTLTGNTLSLTGDATPVDLSVFANTDAQDLTLAGNTLSLTGDATPVDLSAFANTDAQDLTLAGNTLSLTGDATPVDLSAFANTDAQDLTLAGNTLSLTGDATPVDLSAFANTDAQDLTLAGNTLSLTGDATPVDLSAFANTDSQDLTLAGNTLSLTGDATPVDLSAFANTDAQDLTLAGNTLSLTGDATPVDLSAFANTDAQDLTLAGNTLSLTGDATPVDLSAFANTDSQDLTLIGNTLGLTNDATTVDLSGYLDNTDAQDLSLAGTILSLTGDATPVDLSSFAGTDSQDLSLTGNTLSLTNDATTVDLSGYLDNTDAQDLSLTGTILSLTGDATPVDLSSFAGTDSQDLSLTGNTLSLTNDATTVDLSGYLDNTDAQDLSLTGTILSLTGDATPVDLSVFAGTDSQDLSLTGNTLGLTNDATTVDLSGYLDNTDSQDLSLTGTILSLTGDATPVDLSVFVNTNFAENNLILDAARTHNLNGNNLVFTGPGSVGIGTNANPPDSKLDVDGQIQARNGFAASDGSESLPSYSFYQGTDTNTGMYRIGPDHLGFSTGGNLALEIDASENVGIGIAPSAKLHVNGDAIIEGNITVNTTGSFIQPDYVFQSYFTGASALKPDYQMPSLAEVREFVAKYHHLPGVTSEAEVQAQGGIILNHATTQNLEKIEELFLHTIEQEAKIEALQQENAGLAKELEDIKVRMARIEAALNLKKGE